MQERVLQISPHLVLMVISSLLHLSSAHPLGFLVLVARVAVDGGFRIILE
jgi:hypothetical protein